MGTSSVLPIEISVVLPCLNEEKTLGVCIRKVQSFLQHSGVAGEVIVADNGSSDRSVQVAESLGVRLVHVSGKGYGNALRGGFAAARGKYILMADADDSYDLENLQPFLAKLREGYELVMGNRFKGGILPGAMPWLHRYIGNPILSFIGRLFFRSPAHDFHCGIRAFTKASIVQMNLQTTGMELASEIVIKAAILGMKVGEVPTRLFPDGRGRHSHLHSFRDGWRHLRFLLIYSPAWLFAYPGLTLVVTGSLFNLILFFGPINLPFRLVDFHSFIVMGALVVLGVNMLSFYFITRVYAFYSGLLPRPPEFYSLFKMFNLEMGLAIGSVLFFIGLGVILYAAMLLQAPDWFATIGFGRSVRLVFGGSMAIILGGQVIFTSFVLSMLGMKAIR